MAGQDVNMNMRNAPNAPTTMGVCLFHRPCTHSRDADFNPAPNPEPDPNPEPNLKLNPNPDATVGDH